MSPPLVQLMLPDESTVDLGQSGRIGRAWNAEARISDDRVSELHAHVSVRDGEVLLLALAPVWVDGVRVDRTVPLKEEQRIDLVDPERCGDDPVELHVLWVTPNALAFPQVPPTQGARQTVRIELASSHARLSKHDGGETEFSGLRAELLRCLAQSSDPMHRDIICRQFWPERDRARWSGRFEALKRSLKKRLADNRMRTDLVRTSGDGWYRLHLMDGDELILLE